MDDLYDEEIIRCKAIIVGNSGVGKTSIISRYLNKYNPKEKTTIGASFTNKLEEINNNKILFEIWDTAGQEKFRSINSIFYQDAYICLLVYDITDKKSFDDIKDYWYDSVRENSTKDIIFHIVGNKIDLLKNEAVNRDEVKEFCQKIDADINYISAKEETTAYVDALFKKIGEKFIQTERMRKKDISLNKTNNDSKKIKLNETNEPEKPKKKSKRCC